MRVRRAVPLLMAGILLLLSACASGSPFSSESGTAGLPHGVYPRAKNQSWPGSIEALAGKLGFCEAKCVTLKSARFEHPSWGPMYLITWVEADGRSGVAAITPTGEALWRQDYPGGVIELRPAQPVQDASENVFVVYNPGRYDGIAVFRPTTTGFADLAGVRQGESPDGRFYNASLRGPSREGYYEIRQYEHSCDPSCAMGQTTYMDYQWLGTDYSPKGS